MDVEDYHFGDIIRDDLKIFGWVVTKSIILDGNTLTDLLDIAYGDNPLTSIGKDTNRQMKLTINDLPSKSGTK